MRKLKSLSIAAKKVLNITLFASVLLAILGGLITLGVRQQKTLNSLANEISILQNEISTSKLSETDISQVDKLRLQKDLLALKNNQINAQNAIYGTLAQVLGGAFFFVTAYLSFQNLKISEKTLRTTEEKQVTERFGKAVEHLANEDRPEIQLGGIYALDRISKDSSRDYWTIVDILTLFIRSNSPLQGDEEVQEISPSVQAALTIIGQHKQKQDIGNRKVDLSGISLTKIRLKDVNFSNAELIKTDLREAYLSDIDLSSAILREAKLSYVNRKTNGSPVRNIDFTEAILIHADLTGGNFTQANFSRAILDSAKLNDAILPGANFSNATFIQANLSDANLSGANFSEASLQGADLRRANLRGAIFSSKTQVTSEQIQLAEDWQHLDKEFLERLGLYPDRNN